MRLHRGQFLCRVRRRSDGRRAGATLIELLVVLSLIGLLAASMVPALSRSMRAAKATICKHNLREIGMAVSMYVLENDGWLPGVENPSSGLQAIRQAEPWFAKLFPSYIKDPMLLTCPEDPFSHRMVRVGHNMADPRVSDYASYGINAFMVTAGNGALANVERSGPSRPLSTILIADQGPDILRTSSVVRNARSTGRNASLLSWDDGFDPFSGRSSTPWLTRRHNEGVNILTLEGGVREARTNTIMSKPVESYYNDCAAGGCSFCNELGESHYSFAKEHLYWWTGRPLTDF